MMMFKKVTMIALALLVLAPMARADGGGQTTTREQVIGINDAYIPSGFDTGSDAFVVISGLFPNGCYRYKEATVTHTSALVHEVKATATVSEGMCLMVLVPFSKEVQIGKLSRGEHSVRFLNGDGTYWEKKLTVE